MFIPGLRAKVPGIPNLLPTITVPSISLSQFRRDTSVEPVSEDASPSKPSVLGATIANTGNAIGQFAGSVFTTNASSSGNVDVSAVTKQISEHIEQIPSTVLKQAKIEYCKQVLLDAASQATPTP
jgi:hypothetical protein